MILPILLFIAGVALGAGSVYLFTINRIKSFQHKAYESNSLNALGRWHAYEVLLDFLQPWSFKK